MCFLNVILSDQREHPKDTSEGDRIAVRFHLNMTHTGDFNGIPATGKRVTVGGTTIMRFSEGKVVERWSENDFLGLLKQLGVIPESV